MKFLTLKNKLKNLSKRASAGFMAATIAATVLAAPLTAKLTTAAHQVLMEGHVKSLNVTTGETQYKDTTNAKVDDVVQVQLWHHNRENPNGERAQNTRVKFTVPTQPGKTQVITGTSKSDNGNTITDSTTVNLSLDRARVEYIPGSAKFRYNKGAANGDATCDTGFNFAPARCYATVSIPDSVVTSEQGVNLDTIRGGKLRGCNAYHETVTVQVRSKADVVSVNKYVRHEGQSGSEWKTSTNAKPGDKLEYLIRFKNEGNTLLEDVMVGDNMPKYNSYVNGTTKLQNGAFPSGTNITNDNITKGGINVGNYMPGAAGYVWFKVKIDPISAFEKCGSYDVRNVGVVRPKGMNEHYNTAQVKITVECVDEPVSPIFRCDLLNKQLLSGRTYRFTTNATAQNGATIKQYRYKITGPNNYNVDTVSTQANGTLDHTFPGPGTFEITATVEFNVGNEVKVHTSAACKVTVTIPEEPVTPVFRCELLNKEFLGGNKYRFTTNATAQGGATIKQYRYEITGSDNFSANLVSNQPLGAVEQTFPGPGTFTVTATVEFNVGNEVKVHTSADCKLTITIPKAEEKCPIDGKGHLPKDSPDCKADVTPPPTTPPAVLPAVTTRQQLPVTGVSDILGMFIATTLAGTLAHRLVWGRRFGA